MLYGILNTEYGVFINNREYISNSDPMIISPTDAIIILAHKIVY